MNAQNPRRVRKAAASMPEGLPGVCCRNPQSGCEPEENGGHKRQREREYQNALVDPNFAQTEDILRTESLERPVSPRSKEQSQQTGSQVKHRTLRQQLPDEPRLP